MAEHYLMPTRQTLHGILWSQLPPVLKIQSGDIVTINTLEPDWRIERPLISQRDAGVFYPRIPKLDDGHALCGPIEIANAQPGMTLSVEIMSVIPGEWGWSCVGIENEEHLSALGFHNKEIFWLWDIDIEKNLCINEHGYEVPLNPFPGVLAVAPQGNEYVTTKIPGSHGGNIDCRSLIAGSKICLPVFHQGALFSVGDGHAAQGDGESGGTAIECPLKELKLRFTLKESRLFEPICETPEGIITFGFDRDLTCASYKALKNMRRYLLENFAISENEAMMLCSLCVDLRITQIVNGIRGVHAILPNNCRTVKKNRS